MPNTPAEKKKVSVRINRIRGQINALEESLKKDTECSKILQQIAAVRGAVNGLMAEVLESHIRETIHQDPDQNISVNKYIDNTIELVRTYLK